MTRKCSYYQCTEPITKEEIDSEDKMLFCKQHYEELKAKIEKGDYKGIIGFWVRANGGAKRLAESM
jgi:hypothetical protein